MASDHNPCKCIYCFKTLQLTDIGFETVTRVDLEPDRKKLEFLRRRNPDMDEEDTSSWSKPITMYTPGSDEFELDSETGFPVAWNEKVSEEGSDWTMSSTVRVCGYCHMPLPTRFGKDENVKIGLCGNSGSGKTVYVLSMIKDLQKVPNLAVTPDPVFFSKQTTPYDRMYKEMYTLTADEYSSSLNREDYLLPEATNVVSALSPLVLNCVYKGRHFILTFYDMAGEGMKDTTYMAVSGQFLGEVDGVLYLKDPDYFQGFEKFEDALMEYSYSDNLIGMMTKDNHRVHIAVTLTKIDKLYNKFKDNKSFMDIFGESFFNEEYSPYGRGFNIAYARTVNSHMKKLYSWSETEDEHVLNLYQEFSQKQDTVVKKGLFGKKKVKRKENENDDDQWILLFGCSALGLNCHISKDMENRNHVFPMPKGLHNADPVLWLLNVAGYYPSAE